MPLGIALAKLLLSSRQASLSQVIDAKAQVMSPHKPLPAKDLICKEYSIPKLWTEAAGKRKVSALLAVHPGGSLGDDRVVKRDNGLCAAPHKEEEFDEEDEDAASNGQGAALSFRRPHHARRHLDAAARVLISPCASRRQRHDTLTASPR